MRLICPQCSVQYEVDGSLIPANGRDVQCSNCSETWFVKPERTPVPDMRRPSMPRPEPAPEAPAAGAGATESSEAGAAGPTRREDAATPESTETTSGDERETAAVATTDGTDTPPPDPHMEDAYDASSVVGSGLSEERHYDEPADAPGEGDTEKGELDEPTTSDAPTQEPSGDESSQ